MKNRIQQIPEARVMKHTNNIIGNNLKDNRTSDSRGRQALKTSIKTTGETTSHFAAFNTKSMMMVNNKIIPRGNKKVSYYTRKIQYSVEEECESSESEDCRKKLKELNCYAGNESQDGPFREDFGIFSNENSVDEDEDEDEKNEMPMDIQLQYKEKLNNEMEIILIDIYNSHMTLKKRKLNGRKHNFCSFSQLFNEQWNVIFLKILIGKIKELIKRYKSKIFEIPEFKQLRDTFLKNETVLQTKTELANEINLNLNVNISLNLADFSFKKVTKDLLIELSNIKMSLIQSSIDIEDVFKYPLTLLNRKSKANPFHIKDLHIEEYTRTLVEDEFISGLINHIKSLAKQNEEICELISTIEEDRHSTKREMTRLIKFLDENPELFIETEETKLEEISSETEKIKTSAQIFTPTSASSEGSALAKEITNTQSMPAIDIDELVRYIENEENKPKKSKKKAKKKKEKGKEKEKEKKIVIIEETHPLSTTSTDYDKEVEQFKQTITEWGLNQASRQKIKPQFTQEWLMKISICQ